MAERVEWERGRLAPHRRDLSPVASLAGGLPRHRLQSPSSPPSRPRAEDGLFNIGEGGYSDDEISYSINLNEGFYNVLMNNAIFEYYKKHTKKKASIC
ncbi:hypothetical protein ACP4OV_021299 [Aristida adscensionis]